jgi:polyvinyl alcohol dehydrogenase (cytochrome)
MDLGYVSTANDVVHAGSTAATGDDMYALDAATGGVLWSFASVGPVVSGAAIVRGVVYWGSGYYLPGPAEHRDAVQEHQRQAVRARSAA